MNAPEILEITTLIAFVALAIGQIFSMVRLVIGPTSGDRILALDTMVINALGLVVVGLRLLEHSGGQCAGGHHVAACERQ